MELNKTQLAARCWVDSLIIEKGKTNALSIIKLNLTGKNPYWGFNVIFDTEISSYINNVINPS